MVDDCREHPFNLCKAGDKLMHESVQALTSAVPHED